MDSGKVLVAEHTGVYSVKLVGDVRVTQCCQFYDFVQTMVANEHYADCIVDMSETEHMDSTTLGVLASIANGSKCIRPTILAPSSSILRLLKSMAFDRVFSIVDNTETAIGVFSELNQAICSDDEMRDRVIAAHCVLMGMSDQNKTTFSPLVEALQAEKRAG